MAESTELPQKTKLPETSEYLASKQQKVKEEQEEQR